MIKILCILIINFPDISSGQTFNDSTNIETEEIISDLLQEPSEESDNSDLYETIEEFISNPVNINEAGLNELTSIPFIDISTADRIIKYREKSGHFFSVYELYSIDGLTKESIEKISPFITVNKMPVKSDQDNSFFSDLSINFRSKIQADLREKKGFTEKKFKGSKYKIYNRFISEFNNFELGFLMDKDPGENSFSDFSSFSFSLKKSGFINNITLGDYLIKWGQGLALWSSYGLSKGADAVFSPKKNSKVIKRYTGSSENNFFRGAALNLEWRNFSLTAFYSRNKIDANIDSVSHNILSAPVDGLHRTDNEIAKRKSLSETVFGSAIDFHNKFLKTGLVFYNSSFGNSFVPGSIYDIKGNKFSYESVFFDIFIKKINFFGELVYNGISVASINGIEIQAYKDLVFLTTIRSYPRNFNSIHGFSFGEKSGAGKNEFGIYYGLRWISPIGLLNFYYDQFKFPYASYSIPLPSVGHEILLDFKNKFIKNYETGFRFKYEKKEVACNENNIAKIGSRIRKKLRIEINYKLSKQIKLKGRFEYNNIEINNSIEEGFLTFQDIQYHLPPFFDLYTRITFFSTGSFNSAVYEYENDLPGTLISPALYGGGIRCYFVIRIKPYKILAISCKYSETFKPKVNSLGSGLLETEGNLDNRFSFQLDLNY